jgi:transcriptional regulator with XRE-family HTH domain
MIGSTNHETSSDKRSIGLDAKKLRKAREAAGLTQEDAARRARVGSRQRWNDIEHGRRNISLDTLDRIAAALGVSAKDLLK